MVYLTWNSTLIIYFTHIVFRAWHILNPIPYHYFIHESTQQTLHSFIFKPFRITNCTHNNDSINTSQITINICIISLYINKQYGHLYDIKLHRWCAGWHRKYVLYKPIVWRGNKYQKVIFEPFIDSAIYNDIYGWVYYKKQIIE